MKRLSAYARGHLFCSLPLPQARLSLPGPHLAPTSPLACFPAPHGSCGSHLQGQQLASRGARVCFVPAQHSSLINTHMGAGFMGRMHQLRQESCQQPVPPGGSGHLERAGLEGQSACFLCYGICGHIPVSCVLFMCWEVIPPFLGLTSGASCPGHYRAVRVI